MAVGLEDGGWHFWSSNDRQLLLYSSKQSGGRMD
uniref:Uncharacterized protein n=1 Tax=Arundo donax TaxID=35708 RepID=A0A0A9HTY1_ARUDO